MSDATKYTVGWICALPTEFDAAQAFLDEEHEDQPLVAIKDNNNYALGRIGSHNVVIAVLPDGEYGTNAAAAVARDMLHSFPNVRIGVMVGIGGGAPSPKHDVRLGDVVVSSRDGGRGGVFQYDFGKALQGQDVSFEHTDFLDQPPTVLRTAVSALKSRYKRKGHRLNAAVDEALERWPRLREEYSRPPLESDRLYRSEIIHPDSSDGCDSACSGDPAHLIDRAKRGEHSDDPAIHYGLIASANQLMKDARIRDKLAKEGVLCFEMEAAGLMNHFPCLVIRGVCDYADSHKNKQWQGFAAMTAAAYAADILRQIPPNKVEAERRIGDVLGQLQQDFSRVYQAVSETKAVAIATRDNQHLDRLLRWLSPPDPSTNASRARARRHAGTGAWLLESAVFREWEAGKRQHLWLYGMAGCGKTVLSTTILDHLRTSSTPALAFFFDFNDAGKQTLDNLLCSLAIQLYRTGGEVATCVESMMQTLQSVIVVLDALDECTTNGELLSWMQRLASGLNFSNTKLIVTARPEADLLRGIPRLFSEDNCVWLDKQAVDADIRSYVAHELQQRPEFVGKRMPHHLLEQIRDKVGDGADGMFRWAACQLDSLVTCLHPQAIKAALEDLPRDLNETYQRMLQNIPSNLKSDSLRLLQFLVYAKRPLTLAEAVDIIATRVEVEQRGFDVERRLLQFDDVLQYCPGLVSVVVGRWSGEFVKAVQLAHFSVKEYLVCESQFGLAIASIAITMTCLTYLNDIKDTGTTRSTMAEFPLAKHAAEVWMEHGKEAEASEDIVQESIMFLQTQSTFERWSRLYEEPDQPWGGDPDLPQAPRLYYACLGGLLKLSRGLIDGGADFNAEGGFYGNALQAASWNGHQGIVQLLLDKGADVNAEGSNFGNALQTASLNGHQGIVQLLLDEGADVNAKGSDFGNALQIASFKGHQEIVQLLLDEGADVNAEGSSFDNALQAASYRGHKEIVQLLLDKGANVNAKGGDFGNALQAASYRGHQEILQLLLDKGANVNAKGGNYGNALKAASWNGHQEIVQLLLDRGADIKAKGGAFSNALQAASKRNHREIVRLLLDKGAKFNLEEKYFNNDRYIDDGLYIDGDLYSDDDTCIYDDY
ncbi:NACHT and ankyrin domain protein [Colletotrichum tofieldiae]|nr:NACHT and ankyrin domain protein [Colletotrichum tofieldiae]